MTYEKGPEVTSHQKQILYGTILGGSSIIKPKKGRNCYIAMRDKNFHWLNYKVEELNNLFRQDGGVIRKDQTTYRCYSVAYPIFNEIYEQFYENETKIVTRESLDQLTDVAWMIWFLDAGRKSSRKAYLRTHKFGEEGSEIIAEYFNSLDCECELRSSRSRYEIVFSNKGAFNYLKVMAHRVPKFMMDRLE